MPHEITLTPRGTLHLHTGDHEHDRAPDAWMLRVVKGFTSCQASGLFALAATRPDVPPSPAFSYWRDFACHYLTRLCQTPESTGKRIEPIEPPSESELTVTLLSAPPMTGGEYVSFDVFHAMWIDLDAWVRQQIAVSDGGLAEWLKTHAPMWRQVGRVCFHLAENRHDAELPFAFLATYAPSLSAAGKVQYKPLGKALQEYAGERNRQALFKLLSPIYEASEKIAFVRELVDSGDIFHPLAWTPADAYHLLKNVPLLEESGLLVRLPDWWKKRPRPRVTVTIGDKKQSRFSMETMLDFKVELALGDQKLTEGEWKKIVSSEDGLAYVRGQWIEIDREKLAEALAHWKGVESDAQKAGISFIEGMRLLAGAPLHLDADGSVESDDRWTFVDAGAWLSGVIAGLRNPEGLSAAAETGDFRGALRPYQETGRNWLWFLSQLGLGACLADDMGLGKTVQVLSLLSTLKENGSTGKPSLLVLPASLLANWKAEITRFTPQLQAWYIHPSETDGALSAFTKERSDRVFEGADLVLTTYGMLLRQKWLRDLHWRLVILDEAQAIKNPSTRQTKAVKELKADARIALTGTPVENRLSDLWSIFDFLCPGLLGSTAKFKNFVKGLEARERDKYAPLRNLVQPYILRRLKTDRRIIADLPDKTEMKTFCGLSKRQAALYTIAVKDLARALESSDGIQRRGLVLAYLMKFKQICNHPSQCTGDGMYGPGESGKFDRLGAICEEILSRQEKVLVFTQFREMTEPIATFLAKVFGSKGLVLHGGTAVKKRKSLIDRFQKEEGPPFFVLSLKAGGIGLNLTAASHVIHFDRWWNPAVENQATDRAFRIGQHRNVVVHKFVCRGTVEEKIDALIKEKTNLADDILKTGAETLLTEMNNEELLKAVALDIDRATLQKEA